MSSFGESYDPISTVFSGASLYIFQKFQNLESDFQHFQIPDPRKSVLGPGDVFGTFVCPKNHQFIYNVVIVL